MHGSRYVDFRRLYVSASGWRFFVTRTKNQHELSPCLFHAVDEIDRLALRSTITLDAFICQRHYPHISPRGFVIQKPASGSSSDQQFHLRPRPRHLRLYKAVASGAFFQMDKTEPSHQAFLRHVRERGQNAIWTAVGVYALAHHQKQLALDVSLYTFLQILSVHSFEKIQLSCAFQAETTPTAMIQSITK